MNVAETMLAKAENSAVAVLYQGRAVTYGELRAKVAQVAESLLGRGHVKGDRIGILSENSPFFVAAYLGTIKAGLTAVPLQAEAAPGTLSEIVANTGIADVFVSDRLHDRVQPWAAELGLSLLREGSLNAASGNGTTPFPKIEPVSDLAALMFTSGSTGSPKGVMVTHRNIESNTRDIIAYMGLSCADRVMTVLPFHYCFGLSLLHTHLMAGATLVLNNQFRLFPEAVLTEMQQHGCTGLAGVPSTYQILLRKSRFKTLSFPCLRWFQQAGGKLPNPCIREILSSFPRTWYFLMYGQTEATARLSCLPPERLVDKLGSIGKGLPSTRLEVLKADGTPVTAGSDEVGEIVAAGDNIALGYWNDPVETAKFFRNGRLHTGDIARVDADGFIFIVEREREIIKSGGNRISAKEIEDVIAELPEVVEVAVLGVPHELLGEAVKALVVLSPSAQITPQEVQVYCRKRLPAFKVPQEVIRLEAMAHNSSGKILKQELKRQLAHRASGEPEEDPRHQSEACPA